MQRQQRLAIVVLGLVGLLATNLGRADEVRYYQDNGFTFRETRRKVPRTVYTTEMQAREVVRYRPQAAAETRDVVRSVVVPVTENRVENRLVGRWNPFVRQPYFVQRTVPTTRYEYRTETVRVPTAGGPLVAETVVEQVPVPVARVVEDELVSRIAVNAPGGVPLPGAVAATWLVPAPGSPVPGAPVSPTFNPAAIAGNPGAGFPGAQPVGSWGDSGYGAGPAGNNATAGNNVLWRPATRRY